MPPATPVVASVINFRDLGGLPGPGGLVVPHGRLYRSAQLSCMLVDDHAAFAALGIRTIMDLRRPAEIEAFGRLGVVDGFVLRDVYLRHKIWEQQGETDAAGRARFLADRYHDLCAEAAEDIGEALRIIADPANCPVVVHCVAGKDRTGVIIGLTLALLGIDDETIADDFAASEPEQVRLNQWFRTNIPDSHDPRPEYLLAPRQTMLLFLDELRDRHDTVEAYARSIGVTDNDMASLRSHLLRG
jgi:protein tyrosine/serine phosphatase